MDVEKLEAAQFKALETLQNLMDVSAADENMERGYKVALQSSAIVLSTQPPQDFGGFPALFGGGGGPEPEFSEEELEEQRRAAAEQVNQ